MKPRKSQNRREHWIEVNLFADLKAQDKILLDYLVPYVVGLETKGRLVTYHYFREPEIRFRVRLKDKEDKAICRREVSRLARELVKSGLVSRWHFGNHGEKGKEYEGEADRYGTNGWRVAQAYFNRGAETALELLALKRMSGLENPLWGEGLGNPWEGGNRNPWKEREGDPLVFHWSRFVHLFSNQLGFDIGKEVELARKQAKNYAKVADEFGMEW